MAAMTDFFVSYTQADRAWAEWIAWVLEEKGYAVTIQAWDFRPGGNFALDMQRATAEAERTIAVLSPDYVQSRFTAPERAAALAKDPTGEKGILLPVRVREVELEGLLPQIVYIDLVGIDEDTSRVRLLAGVRRERAKPATAPSFPGKPPRPFPGTKSGNPDPDPPVDTIPDLGPLPAGSRMPFARNPLFVGRGTARGNLESLGPPPGD
jgi:TIR domain